MKTKLTWLLLKLLSKLLNVERQPTIVVFDRDNTVTMQRSGENKVTKQFN